MGKIITSYIFIILLFGSGKVQALPGDTLFIDTLQVKSFRGGEGFRYFVDTDSEFSATEILELSDSNWLRDDELTGTKKPATVWAMGRVKNQGNEPFEVFLHSCYLSSKITVFSVEGDRPVDLLSSWVGQPIEERLVPSLINFVKVNLAPSDSKTLLIKTSFPTPVSSKHLSELYFNDGTAITSQYFQRSAWQFAYAGCIFFLITLAWIIAGLFRNQSFVFYGFLMLFFVPYFMASYNLAYANFGLSFLSRLDIISLSVAGIVAFGYGFVRSFVRLYNYYPLFNISYLAVSILTIVLCTLADISESADRAIMNISTGLWIVFTLAAAVLSMRKGVAEGTFLLISLLILNLGGLVYIVQIIGFSPSLSLGRYGFQVGSLLFSLVLFYGLVREVSHIRDERQQALETERLKSRFFENISHEFRTPLSLIMDPLHKVAARLKAGEDKRLLQTAYRSSEQLLDLINQIMELTKLEVAGASLHLQEQNLPEVLEGMTGAFETLANERSIHLSFSSEVKDLRVYLDENKLQKIMNNLLYNAIKFCEAGDEISVVVSESQGRAEVAVRDTGAGIDRSELPRLFDRFFTSTAASAQRPGGSGIGLALVKELLKVHRGGISVESQLGKGSSFTFWLPTHSSAYTKAELDSIKQSSSPSRQTRTLENTHTSRVVPENGEVQELSGMLKKGSKHRLLLIEDNDPVRKYILRQLKDDFEILEARNGQEGIDLAQAELPDVIICDVMMPVKDGNEVVLHLKSDVRTSHIPIILLTAKAGIQNKLKGLSDGADDYLMKPFDSDELRVRAHNLIRERKKLQEKFSASGSFSADGLGQTDTKFLEDLKTVLHKQFREEEFGVEQLAEGVGMSRSSLNRKLKSLVGISANKVIQTYRLEQGKILLEKRSGNISEVAFECGFSSPSYFVKCFREKYGTTPGSLTEKEP